jgi:Na+/melibiose symporter-like transporter
MGEGDVRRVAFFALINLVVLGSLTAPVVTGLPLVIARLVPEGERTGALALVTICGALASVAANPLFGVLSDRTPGRFGRRRPWLLGGAVVGLVGSVVIVAAESVIVLTVGWVLAQTAYNASFAAVAAMLGDQVAERQRASASGVFGAAAFLGTVPPLILATVLPTRLSVVVLAMPIVAVIVVAVCCALISDPPLARSTLSSGGPQQPRPRIDIRRNRLFAWMWLQRFLMQLALSFTTVFTLFFVMNRLTLDAAQSSPVAAAATLAGGAGIVLAALGAGFRASRTGNYGSYLLVAALGLAGAAVLRATVGGSTQLWVSAAVGGLAMGVFYAVDLALVLRAIPAGAAGTYLGVFNIAETLPATFAPAVAVAVLAVAGTDPLTGSSENYTVLYLTAAGIAVMALVPMLFLRPILTRTARIDAEQPGRLVVR